MKKITALALASAAGMLVGCETDRNAMTDSDSWLRKHDESRVSTLNQPMSFDPAPQVADTYSTVQTSYTPGTATDTTRDADRRDRTRDRRNDGRNDMNRADRNRSDMNRSDSDRTGESGGVAHYGPDGRRMDDTNRGATDNNANYRQDDHRANPDKDAKDNQNRPNRDMAMSGSPEAQILSVLNVKNQEEIQFGRLAQERGMSDDVKRYGEHLVRDHEEASNEVKATARNLGITLLSDADTRDMINREKRGDPTPQADPRADPLADLRNVEGSAFDKQFAQHMKMGHRELINRVESAQTQVRDDKVRRLLNKLLPTLREHEREAERILEASSDK